MSDLRFDVSDLRSDVPRNDMSDPNLSPISKLEDVRFQIKVEQIGGKQAHYNLGACGNGAPQLPKARSSRAPTGLEQGVRIIGECIQFDRGTPI